MAVEYPLPLLRSWIGRGGIQEHNQSDETQILHPQKFRPMSSYSRASYKQTNLQNSDKFVLFVRMPDWPRKGSIKSSPEIRTLRGLRSGVEILQVKASLEFSAGLPAHITTLHTVENKCFSDDTKLILNENISNCSSLRLHVAIAWEECIRAAWIGNIRSFLNQLSAVQSKAHVIQQLARSWQRSTKEQAFCALFVASSHGNIEMCEAILKNSGVDVNQTTMFGNTCLHCAAYNGHLEVIQLLATFGADIRFRNMQGKSALDLAVASDFIECARWLWLNQWSLTIARASTAPLPTTSLTKSHIKVVHSLPENINASKSVVDCHTLFTKTSFQVNEIPEEKLVSLRPSSGITRPNIKDHIKMTKKYFRPQSSPSAWSGDIKNNHTNLLPKAVHTPTRFTQNETTVLNALHKVQRSPDNQENSSRYISRQNIHADKTSQMRRPNTAMPKFSNAEATKPPTVYVPKLLPELRASIKRETSIPSKYECRLQSQKLTGLSVESEVANIKSLKVDVSSSYKTGFWTIPQPPSTSNQMTVEYNASEQDCISKASSSESKSTDIESSYHDNNLSKLRSEIVQRSPIKKIDTHVESDVRQGKMKDNQITKNETLHNGGHALERSNKSYPNSTERATHNYSSPVDHTKKRSTDSSIPSKLDDKRIPTSSPEKIQKPSKVSIPQNEKKESKTSDMISKEELLRKERNERAWSKWMEAKQREHIAQKKAEAKQHEKAVIRWGITFEEWLETKQKGKSEKIVAEPHNSSRTVVNRPSTSGKSFEEWLKDKAAENSKISKISDDKSSLTEDEMKKLEELREKKFQAWYQKKMELNREQNLRSKTEEKQKLLTDQEMLEKWKSKPRVMCFESWKKEKDKKRRSLSIMTEVEEEASKRIASWTEEDRKQRAEIEYAKWVLRKQSLEVQQAEEELEQAKTLRRKAEQNAVLRKALLRSKALMKWKKFSKSNPDIRELENNSKKSSRQHLDSASSRGESVPSSSNIPTINMKAHDWSGLEENSNIGIATNTEVEEDHSRLISIDLDDEGFSEIVDENLNNECIEINGNAAMAASSVKKVRIKSKQKNVNEMQPSQVKSKVLKKSSFVEAEVDAPLDSNNKVKNVTMKQIKKKRVKSNVKSKTDSGTTKQVPSKKGKTKSRKSREHVLDEISPDLVKAKLPKNGMEQNGVQKGEECTSYGTREEKAEIEITAPLKTLIDENIVLDSRMHDNYTVEQPATANDDADYINIQFTESKSPISRENETGETFAVEQNVDSEKEFSTFIRPTPKETLAFELLNPGDVKTLKNREVEEASDAEALTWTPEQSEVETLGISTSHSQQQKIVEHENIDENLLSDISGDFGCITFTESTHKPSIDAAKAMDYKTAHTCLQHEDTDNEILDNMTETTSETNNLLLGEKEGIGTVVRKIKIELPVMMMDEDTDDAII